MHLAVQAIALGADRLSDLGIPVVSELPFGHDGQNAALPVGIMVELDGDKGTLL